MPVENVQGRDRAGLCSVGRIAELVLGHQLALGLQVRAGDDERLIVV